MAKKTQTVKLTTALAVGRAFELMIEVHDDLLSNFDDRSEKWQEGDTGQRHADVIATLDSSISEPDTPAWIEEDEIESTGVGKTTKPAKRDEAVGLLEKVIELARAAEACEDVPEDDKAEIGAFIETLTETKDEWDGIDFP